MRGAAYNNKIIKLNRKGKELNIDGSIVGLQNLFFKGSIPA